MGWDGSFRVQNRSIAGLSFFTFSVIDVQERRSYPIQSVQMIKKKEEEAQKKKVAQPEKRPLGRPKGSQNKNGEAVLGSELLRIQPVLQAFWTVLKGVLAVRYLVMDGHFGNYPSAWMVLQTGLQYVSKLRADAALYEPFTGEQARHGARRKYGDKVDVHKMKGKYLRSDTQEKGIRTQIYQARWLSQVFGFPLNVVVILKTNLSSQAQAHAILFSTDLELSHEKIMDYYSLRFQIEFNFRDAKQYWDLDDFMNIKEVAVTNAAQLSFFMVNFSSVLLQPFREHHPDFSVLDLKSHYRGRRYVSETIKWLPQKPEAILLAQIVEQIARLGMIHPFLSLLSLLDWRRYCVEKPGFWNHFNPSNKSVSAFLPPFTKLNTR
jgi:hypothetical protein